MLTRFRTPALLLLQFIAFWPVWTTYAERMLQFDECRPGLVALCALGIYYGWRVGRGPLAPVRVWVPSLFVLLYALLCRYIHPIGGSIIAMLAIGVTLGQAAREPERHDARGATPALADSNPSDAHGPQHSRFNWGVLALALLALPIIPSMQTYIGFPLRTMVSCVTIPILRFYNFDVVREGTCVRMGQSIVCVDEPCSGIKMLWTGFCLLAAIAAFRGMNLKSCIAGSGLALAAVVIGNILRSVPLCICDLLGGTRDKEFHLLTGVVMFAIVSIAILWGTTRYCDRRTPCGSV